MSIDVMDVDSLFSLEQVPFSTFGSWNAISIPKGETELFFRSFHGEANDLFPMRILADRKVVTPDIVVEPWVLTLKNGEGQVDICFERPGTVRMRGRGLGFQLGARTLAYSDGPRRVVINCPFTRRYQIELLHGNLELFRADPETPNWAKQAIVTTADDDRWELAIDEFASTWQRPERATFDRCLEMAKKDFVSFLASMPEVRFQDRHARNLAAYINWSSAVEPCGLVKRPSLLMSKNWMSKIWSWDHCFNAIALAAGQPELAMDQILTIADHQDEFGCFPDSINDVHITYNFSKPPVHGMACREMLRRLPHRLSDETMEAVYSILSAQANWWMIHRRLDRSPLPYYLHGNDSGWDNSTMFEKGVPLVSPDLAALLIVQMDVLAELATTIGKTSEAVGWSNRADELQEALLDGLWRDDHFVARLGVDGTVVESQSLIPWMPIVLGMRLPADIRGCLKTGIETHLTEWGLATEKIESPLYDEDGYWRGPIWAPSTYIAVTGLDLAGYGELADVISERFCAMCRKSGFPENFHAVTGSPLRCPSYTWTSSVFLLLAERLYHRAAHVVRRELHEN
jgi:putative isomerase